MARFYSSGLPIRNRRVRFVDITLRESVRCMAAELRLAAHKVKKAMESLLTPNLFYARNSATKN